MLQIILCYFAEKSIKVICYIVQIRKQFQNIIDAINEQSIKLSVQISI